MNIRRALLITAGLVAFAVAGSALISRHLPITNHAVFFTAALFPYLTLCAPVSMALLTLARRWTLAIVAIGLTVTMLAVQLPLYVGADTPRSGGVELRVISANLGFGSPYLATLAREQTDVLAVQELTPGEVDRLSAARICALTIANV
jgi:hypothetical protein